MQETILLQNILSGQPYEYANELMNELSTRYKVLIPKRHNFEPHFTLKHKFYTDDLPELTKVVGNYLQDINKAPVKVGGFGTFREGDVIYIGVDLSDEARKLFREFYKFLETLPNVDWNEYDKEKLNFHVTLCVSCQDNYKEIMDYLQDKEQFFDSYLDNVTILKLLRVENGNNIWGNHKKFYLK